MKHGRIWAAVLACALLFTGCAGGGDTSANAPSTPMEEAFAGRDMTLSVRLMAVGDNLIHDVIYQQAAARGSGGYHDFGPVYRQIAPIVAKADIAVINQEVPVASDLYPLSSYPAFNSPKELAGQVEGLGFNVVSYANNHMYDKGSAGLAESKRVFDALPSVTVAGIYERGSYDDIPIREENGIRFAFLSYMEMTNVGSSGDTCGIYLKDEKTIRRQMELARQQADFIVVNVHWGAEGSDTPNAYQKEEAQKLADWGADLILGHHPHVLQPIAELTAADGRQVPVIYSLGNFVSAQKGNYNMAGGFLDCTVVLDMKTGETRVEGLSFIPTVTQFGSRFSNLHIVPFADWSESQAAAHGLAGNGFSYQFVKRQLENTFGNYLKTGA